MVIVTVVMAVVFLFFYGVAVVTASGLLLYTIDAFYTNGRRALRRVVAVRHDKRSSSGYREKGDK